MELPIMYLDIIFISKMFTITTYLMHHIQHVPKIQALFTLGLLKVHEREFMKV